MEDSPRPKVWALLDGGALRAGLGCGGDGGMGPTLVWYRLGAGSAAEETTTSLPRAAAGVATAVAGGATAGAAAVGRAAANSAAMRGEVLESPAGGGEERRTRGQKVLPPRVFAMLKSKKEKKGVGWGGGGN